MKFTVVLHEDDYALSSPDDQLILLPQSMFTENQQRAIAYITARRGQDPFPIPEDHGTPAPAGMDRNGEKVARRATSKAQGYTGDECDRCHMFTMKQSGHCLVCDSCGETTGCS